MIKIEGLSYRYPDGTRALNTVNLAVEDGELLLICGPNGSGKTTLIRHMNGILTPSVGRVRVNGLLAADHSIEVRRQVGMLFQDVDSQLIGETVREDIAFGPENLGLSLEAVRQQVDWALEAMSISHLAEKPCYQLSGGEKRRVAIAGVLAMKPHTLIFDEPFSNLDYRGIQEALRQLLALHRDGHTVIVTTHDVEKVIGHASRVVIMERGEIVVDGSPAAILPLLSRHGVRPPCTYLAGVDPQTWLNE
jgi:biotin transport system ATP-binding protein